MSRILRLQARTIRVERWGASSAGALLLCACEGPQSALDPAAEGATRIADLFWVMTAGSAAIWLAVVALAIHALYREPSTDSAAYRARLIVGGGVVLPTLVLALLLGYGLLMLPPLMAAAPDGSLTVDVTAEQYWWRVRYRASQQSEPYELANELHIPLGQPVQLELSSRDVIHSFWVPALGGKVDMIPGHRTHLALRPTRTGVFRGACAEFCGTAHALMSLHVVVHEPREFLRWRQAQALPALAAGSGADLFQQTGCGACHSIRGTPARGVVGPDLTHVGSRLSLGAGALTNGRRQLERWLASTEQIKPGVQMPSFHMLEPAQLSAISAYLESLQ